jgi:hypothetical protein
MHCWILKQLAGAHAVLTRAQLRRHYLDRNEIPPEFDPLKTTSMAEAVKVNQAHGVCEPQAIDSSTNESSALIQTINKGFDSQMTSKNLVTRHQPHVESFANPTRVVTRDFERVHTRASKSLMQPQTNPSTKRAKIGNGEPGRASLLEASNIQLLPQVDPPAVGSLGQSSQTSPETPFLCPASGCGKSYASRKGLSDHKWRKHRKMDKLGFASVHVEKGDQSISKNPARGISQPHDMGVLTPADSHAFSAETPQVPEPVVPVMVQPPPSQALMSTGSDIENSIVVENDREFDIGVLVRHHSVSPFSLASINEGYGRDIKQPQTENKMNAPLEEGASELEQAEKELALSEIELQDAIMVLNARRKRNNAMAKLEELRRKKSVEDEL